MRPVYLPLNAALWRDLERRLGTRDLVEWIERKAGRVAALGRSHRDPVDFPNALLHACNVISLRPKLYLPALQTIQPTPQGYEIHYNSFQQIEDTRFGIAHEIAHTFWFAPGGGGNPLSPLQRTIGDDPTIEWLSKRAAAAILLPRIDLTEVIEAVPMVLHQISSLAKYYVVPERLVARRIFHELAGNDYTLLSVRLQDGKHGEKKGMVVWFAAAPSMTNVSKRVENRVIPRELLPEIPTGTTKEVEIDGRWWLLANSASSPERAKPLSNYPPIKPDRAWVGRTGDVWYLTLPSRAK